MIFPRGRPAPDPLHEMLRVRGLAGSFSKISTEVCIYTPQRKFGQLIAIVPCFNLNALPVADKSLCCNRLCLHSKSCFIGIDDCYRPQLGHLILKRIEWHFHHCLQSLITSIHHPTNNRVCFGPHHLMELFMFILVSTIYHESWMWCERLRSQPDSNQYNYYLIKVSDNRCYVYLGEDLCGLFLISGGCKKNAVRNS